MNNPTRRDIYLSFFMFTANMNPDDAEYRKIVINHIKELIAFGYTGFEFPIGTANPKNYHEDIGYYQQLRSEMNLEGLENVKIATNVGATEIFDPSSSNPEQRQQALEYIKSRVDITIALKGEIMMGPSDHSLWWFSYRK